MKLIIFTTCKPFIDDDAWRQEQAIKSWMLLEGMEKQIIIIGNDAGTKEICEKHNLTHEPNIKTLLGVPYLYSMFEIANKYATDDDVLLWTNADMLYFNTMITCIKSFKRNLAVNELKKYLLIGRRIDWFNPRKLKHEDLNENIIKNINWHNTQSVQVSLMESLNYECAYHQMTGIDYVIHSKSTFVDIIDPNLVIAGWRHDMVLVGAGISNNIFTCNISDVNPCIHQNHDYNGQNQSKRPGTNNPLWVNNQRCYGIQRAISDAPHKMFIKNDEYKII